MGTFLVGAVVFACLGLAVYSLYRSKKQGKACAGCGCGCDSKPAGRACDKTVRL
jgi:hypothetical protein